MPAAVKPCIGVYRIEGRCRVSCEMRAPRFLEGVFGEGSLLRSGRDFWLGHVTIVQVSPLGSSQESRAKESRVPEESNGEQATDRFIRGTTKVVVCVVAIIAAIVSYRHAYAVVVQYGESGITAIMIPLTIDGLVYAASMVILHSARVGTRTPWLAWLLLWVGIAATLAANVAHGLQNGIVGSIVAAWPAVALVGCYEMLMWLVRSGARQTDEPEQVNIDVDRQAIHAYRESVRIGSPMSERRLADRFGQSRRWARRIISRASSVDPE